MSARCIEQTSHSPEATGQLAARLGQTLRPGDTVLLSGPIGAGKSLFCREIILSRLETPEDVPSPTFTLVQTYETSEAEIWHCDLYRIGNTLDVEELGLFDAFDSAICLVEWPDRLGDDAPRDALDVSITTPASDPDARVFSFAWTHPKWRDRLKEFIHE